MLWWEAASWGLFGGFIVDGLELYGVVRRNAGIWPSDCRSLAFVVVEVIRLVTGAGLAMAFSESGQISGAVGAIMIGVAAPLIVEKMSRQLPKI